MCPSSFSADDITRMLDFIAVLKFSVGLLLRSAERREP